MLREQSCTDPSRTGRTRLRGQERHQVNIVRHYGREYHAAGAKIPKWPITTYVALRTGPGPGGLQPQLRPAPLFLLPCLEDDAALQ